MLALSIASFFAALVLFFFAFIFKADSKERGTNTSSALRALAATALILGLGLLSAASTYTQEAGTVKVVTTASDGVVNVTTKAGTHFKAPWAQVASYTPAEMTISMEGSVDDEMVKEAFALWHASDSTVHTPGFMEIGPADSLLLTSVLLLAFGTGVRGLQGAAKTHLNRLHSISA